MVVRAGRAMGRGRDSRGVLAPVVPQALPVQGGIPQFDWQDSLLLLGRWTLGLLIARATSRLGLWAISFLLLCFVAGLLFAGLSRLAPGLILSILQLIHEQAFDVIVGLWPLAGGVAVVLGVLRAYFWLPELAWMLALATTLSQGKNAARMLPLLPPRFDQLIILPLPFMDKIIVQAHRENPAAVQQFIRYLISETNQQAVAARAMRGIAEDVLARCQAVQDIVHAADQLAWLPTPLPKGFSPFFAELLDVSKGVRTAMQATSPYRQSQELARQISLLEGIQNRLAAAGHMSDATTFGGVAKRWLGLLQALRQSLEARAKATEEVDSSLTYTT